MLPAPRIPELPEPLSDGVVALRAESERDIPEVLVAHDRDAELHRSRGLARPPSGAELGRAIEDAPRRHAEGLDTTLTILDGGPDGTFAGQLIVHTIAWEDRRAELGIWLAPEARGRGLGRRALLLAARWLFERWGMERVGLGTDPENAAMLACAHAAGFRPEGTLRAHALIDGRRRDEVVLGLLPADLASAAGTGGPAR